MSQFLVFLFHWLQKNEFFEKQDQLDFSVFEIGLESILFFLHFFDLAVEVINFLLAFSLELVFLEFELNTHNLIVFFIEVGRHVLVSFTWRDSIEVRINVIVSGLEFRLCCFLSLCSFFLSLLSLLFCFFILSSFSSSCFLFASFSSSCFFSGFLNFVSR